MNSYYTEEELRRIGFKKIGKNVLISKKASIYGASKMELGNNIRIDDFCFLSGKIKLGNYIHISAYSLLVGGEEGIEMEDFSGLSSKVTIYAVSDDYSGEYLTNPTVNPKYTNHISKKVHLKKHVIVGTNSTLLPGVTLEEGVAIGAMSLVNKNISAWKVAIGIPSKIISERKKGLLMLEEKFLKEKNEV